ncbi:DUF427 domain-containing protein [Litoreibacter janthinus]|uniref:Uncharacterized conserved protein, DUF427 family n=1 Tax=Litoreibacter janthinus TaxID=670154 RepID=A0A1I6GNV2_9RHOB|nr:DUF427 domain-containing protein [Litoreibacter janthinus]SFR43801.1 Uncharacterized conserved protein, DUF427 family [Litoreibacter janthinus]
MADTIKLRNAPGSYSIRAAGAVLGESSNVIELSEGNLAPVLYVPREDLAMAFFDKNDTTSHCPHKGDASYYTLEAKSGPIKDAAWSYETPNEGLERIAGHLAFYADKVTVEEV